MANHKKPLRLRAAEGDKRKIGRKKLEALIKAEPRTQGGLPDCPDHLTGLARDTWERWTEQLAIMELDRRPDAEMLEGACVAYQRAVKADCEIQRDGITLRVYKVVGEGENAEQVLVSCNIHPAIKISERAWAQVKAFCVEFGFTPASRAKLATAKQERKPVDLMAVLMADEPKEAIQ
jgi:P27 family predicted phage terminase small subunit